MTRTTDVSARLFIPPHREARAQGIQPPAVGEQFTWNTSARNIVGKLFWMLDHGWFDPTSAHGPVQFRIAGTKLRADRTVEKIKPMGRQWTDDPYREANSPF